MRFAGHCGSRALALWSRNIRQQGAVEPFPRFRREGSNLALQLLFDELQVTALLRG